MINISLLVNLLKKNTEKRAVSSDFLDQLHSKFTVVILGCFAIVVGMKQHIGSPISCKLPAEFIDLDSWAWYISDYCYIHATRRNTRAMMVNNYQPFDSIEEANYYQWIPFFFIFQMLCFSVPNLLWKCAQSFMYIDFNAILSAAAHILQMDTLDKRKMQEDLVSDIMWSSFVDRRAKVRSPISSIARLQGFASAIYVTCKIFCLANAVFQMYLLSAFLGFPDNWAIDILGGWGSGRERSYEYNGTTLYYFPVVVTCTYEVIIAHLPPGTASHCECLLTINWINEKLFVALWTWLAILIVFTSIHIMCNFLYAVTGQGQASLKFGLMRGKTALVQAEDQVEAEAFVISFLGADGLLIMRFIEMNCGQLVKVHVLENLFAKFKYSGGMDIVKQKFKYSRIVYPSCPRQDHSVDSNGSSIFTYENNEDLLG